MNVIDFITTCKYRRLTVKAQLIWTPYQLAPPPSKHKIKKSRIRETKHLLTDADSSTDAIGGWTKNTPKPDFFEKQKKLSKMQKLKNV